MRVLFNKCAYVMQIFFKKSPILVTLLVCLIIHVIWELIKFREFDHLTSRSEVGIASIHPGKHPKFQLIFPVPVGMFSHDL